MGKKTWKNGGDEDKFVSKLLKDGKIHKSTSAAQIKKQHPQMFLGFSNQVVRNHLNELKRLHGIYLGGSDDESEVECDGEEKEIESYDASQKTNNLHSSNTNSGVLNINYPVIINTYKSMKDQLEMVILVVCLPSGVQKPQIELNDDGTVATISYKWPKTIYNMEDLFQRQLRDENDELTLCHPKIVAISNALETVRDHIDSAPIASMVFDLPIRVQTAVDTWTKKGIARDDGRV